MYIFVNYLQRGIETLNSLLSYLSAERQNRVKKFMKIDDSYSSLIGNLMVRILLKERYGSSIEEIEVCINTYGKPFYVGSLLFTTIFPIPVSTWFVLFMMKKLVSI